MDLNERFDDLVEALMSGLGDAGGANITRPGETGAKGFGSDSLRVNGSIFAMVSSTGFVVKLPRSRVDQLVAEGAGHRFDANKGRPMKEWLVVDPRADDVRWLSLSEEALAYVGGLRKHR